MTFTEGVNDTRRARARWFMKAADQAWMRDRNGNGACHTSGPVRSWRTGLLLGYAMHCIQDIYAHGNISPLGHFFSSNVRGEKMLDYPDWLSTYEKKHGRYRGWRRDQAINRSRGLLASFRFLNELR